MSKQKGQGLVEFALILPLLLLMFFGILEFGRIFQAYLTVQHAAREAARYAVTGQGGATEGERVRAIKEKAVEATAGLNVDKIDWREADPLDAAHWDHENKPNALLVQVYAQKEEGLTENDAGDPGERVLVRVIYNYQPLTPFFSSLFPYIALLGQMEMINEGFGVTGASHGGVLPPTLEPLPEMGPYPSYTLFTNSVEEKVDQYILGKDLIYVTVTDKDENYDIQSKDTVFVTVRDKSPGGDSEGLILTEIGPNAGVFRNTTGLPSTSGTPNDDNGELETGAGHTIIAEYTDDDDSTDTSSDKARMIGVGASDTDFTDSGGADVEEYVIGVDGIYVTVEDSDENKNSGLEEEVSVTVTDITTGDSETLVLTEIGPNAGVFRNTTAPLSSSSDPTVPVSPDGILKTGVGNTIRAEYTDADDSGDWSRDEAIMLSPPTPSTTRFTNSAGGDITLYAIGIDGIYVTVDDTDENTNSLTPQEISVTVTDIATGDSEMLVLIETGISTGVFRNITPLSSGPNPMGIRDNGLLETQGGHRIAANYTDDDGGDNSDDWADMVAQATDSTTSFTDSGGTDVDVYNIGVDSIYVTVRDGDENVNSGSAEEVTVRITDKTGDQVILTLTETGSNTGVFRNTTGLQSITDTVDVSDNELQTQGGSTITASYTDDDDDTDTSSDTALMGTESTTRFTDSGGVDVIQYAIGFEDIYVTVEDADKNTTSGLDTISVSVSDSETGDGEVLTLTETGADTGVFRNTEGLPSSSGSGFSDDRKLNTAPGNTIVAVYVDQEGEADRTSDTATMIGRTPSTTSFTDNLGVEQEEYYLGTQLIYVTVEDADENVNSSVVETVSVTVTDGEAKDSETLTLYETGPDTGVFRNTVGLASTQKHTGKPDNNLLETQPGNIITASYTDDDDGTDTSSDTAPMRASDKPPDLVVTDIAVEDTNLVVGVPVSVTVTVRNQNLGSVTSTLFDIDFYIYTDLSSQPVPGRPGDAKQWYTENVPGGTEIYLVYSIAFPQEGTLYLYAQADTSDRVVEANETNNIYRLEAPYVTVEVGCYELFNDNMESGDGGWTTQEVRDDGGDTAPFAIVEHGSGYYHSATHAWWVDNADNYLQTYLISRQIPVPSGLANVQLSFWHRMRAEIVAGKGYDGGWLEYNIDGSGWNDVTADMFDSGGYNGQTSSDCPSCGGVSHEAWTGEISWQGVVVNIPITDTTGEHTIQFRWHFECDSSGEHLSSPNGWWIDDVMVGNCQEPPPPPPPGSGDCATVFQDNFSGTLSQWGVSNTNYAYINNGQLRLRVRDLSYSTEQWARTAQNIDLSGYEWAALSYSWWTNALDGTGEWGRVRVSDDGGSTWTTVATYYGTDSGSASITLPGAYGLALTSNFKIEFRVRADKWQPTNYESFEVDNVVLETCNTVPPPPPQTGTGNIVGRTSYYDPATGDNYDISGVDIWAWRAGEPFVYTYSLGNYTYGFYNLDAGTYTIYAEAIINNDLYNKTYTVEVYADQTTTRNIRLTRVY